MRTAPKFAIIGANVGAKSWNGTPLTLAYHESAMIPETPDGSMVLGYQNMSKGNNLGKLILTSGGSRPVSLPVQPLINQPSILVQNWGANNLTLTNVSINTATPIWIEAFGPGMPGQPTPKTITSGGPAITLSPADLAQGTASPQFMQLAFTSNSPTTTIVAFIGGPQDASGNNAFVISLNDSVNGNTGPGTGVAAPAGYYATNGGNNYSYEFNWGSSNILMMNMSSANAAAVSVQMLAL